AAALLRAETGEDVTPGVADVGVPAQAEGLVERVHRELGRLDVLFCNASGPPAAPFSQQTGDAFHRAVELNLLSAVHLARSAGTHGTHRRARGGGRVPGLGASQLYYRRRATGRWGVHAIHILTWRSTVRESFRVSPFPFPV